MIQKNAIKIVELCNCVFLWWLLLLLSSCRHISILVHCNKKKIAQLTCKSTRNQCNRKINRFISLWCFSVIVKFQLESPSREWDRDSVYAITGKCLTLFEFPVCYFLPFEFFPHRFALIHSHTEWVQMHSIHKCYPW